MSLEMVRGDDRAIQFEMQVSETDQTPRPLGLGEVVKFTLKRRYGDTDASAIAQKSTANVLEINWDAGAGLAGVGTIFIGRDETKALPNQRTVCYCDLQLTEIDGKVRTIKANEELIVVSEVTLSE